MDIFGGPLSSLSQARRIEFKVYNGDKASMELDFENCAKEFGI